MVKIKTAFGWCVCNYGDELSPRNNGKSVSRKDETTETSKDLSDASSATTPGCPSPSSC